MIIFSSPAELQNYPKAPPTTLEQIAQCIRLRAEARRDLAVSLEGAAFSELKNSSIAFP